MKVQSQLLLLHPVFLLSLTLLLSNDLFLKYEFHNSFTGKLSDFAGLFTFAVFFMAIFPRHKKHIIIAVSILFIWWKSALSSSFILFINEHLSLPVTRVIDYTDLFALFVLPFAYILKPVPHPSFIKRTVALYAAGGISIFAFCATTIAPRHLLYQPYRENETDFNESFNSSLTETEILDKLGVSKKAFKTDSARFYHVSEPGQFYQRIKKQSDSNSAWIPVTHNADTALFVKKEVPVFYILPEYVLEGDTLYNMEIRVYASGRKSKPTAITIQSFQARYPDKYNNFFYGKLHKEYKKHFRKLFRD